MYVGLKQPRGDGERYVTPARAAAKETRLKQDTGRVQKRKSSKEGGRNSLEGTALLHMSF